MHIDTCTVVHPAVVPSALMRVAALGGRGLDLFAVLLLAFVPVVIPLLILAGHRLTGGSAKTGGVVECMCCACRATAPVQGRGWGGIECP